MQLLFSFLREIIVPFIVDIIKEFFVVNLKETVTNADSTNNPPLDAYINPYSL